MTHLVIFVAWMKQSHIYCFIVALLKLSGQLWPIQLVLLIFQTLLINAGIGATNGCLMVKNFML